MFFPPQSGRPFDPLAGPQGPAVTWLDRIFSLLPGDPAFWAMLDRGMLADPMRYLVEAYGPLGPGKGLLSDEALGRIAPGAVPPPPPAPELRDLFLTPVLPPPRY